jgi:hypothetical protein
MTALQTQLCEDLLAFEQLKADLRGAEGRHGLRVCLDVRVQLEALGWHYAALARAILAAGRIPFES